MNNIDINEDAKWHNVWQVTPINDTQKHIKKYEIHVDHEKVISFCPCRPKKIILEAGVVIVHNSFDGREVVEWFNEIIKEK